MKPSLLLLLLSHKYLLRNVHTRPCKRAHYTSDFRIQKIVCGIMPWKKYMDRKSQSRVLRSNLRLYVSTAFRYVVIRKSGFRCGEFCRPYELNVKSCAVEKSRLGKTAVRVVPPRLVIEIWWLYIDRSHYWSGQTRENFVYNVILKLKSTINYKIWLTTFMWV